MDERDVVQLIQFYRHDVMNQLQLFHGYLSMDKPEKVKDSLHDYMTKLEKERKLLNTNAASFALWLLFFNDTHSNIRLCYDIDIENFHLEKVDSHLTDQCKRIFRCLNEQLPQDELYEAHFSLTVENIHDGFAIQGNLHLEGDFTESDITQIRHILGASQIEVTKTNSGMQCVFALPFQNEVD